MCFHCSLSIILQNNNKKKTFNSKTLNTLMHILGFPYSTSSYIYNTKPKMQNEVVSFNMWEKEMKKDWKHLPRTSWEHLTTSVCGCSIVISNPETKPSVRQDSCVHHQAQRHLLITDSPLTKCLQHYGFQQHQLLGLLEVHLQFNTITPAQYFW